MRLALQTYNPLPRLRAAVAVLGAQLDAKRVAAAMLAVADARYDVAYGEAVTDLGLVLYGAEGVWLEAAAGRCSVSTTHARVTVYSAGTEVERRIEVDVTPEAAEQLRADGSRWTEVQGAQASLAEALRLRDEAEARHEALLARLRHPFGPGVEPPVFVSRNDEQTVVAQVLTPGFDDIEAVATTSGEACVMALTAVARRALGGKP